MTTSAITLPAIGVGIIGLGVLSLSLASAQIPEALEPVTPSSNASTQVSALEIPEIIVPELPYPNSSSNDSTSESKLYHDIEGFSDQELEILVRLTVKRKGQESFTDTSLRQSHRLHWDYGPAIATVRFPMKTEMGDTDRRNWIYSTLDNWVPNSDYYLDLLKRYERADMSKSYQPKARKAYFSQISDEVTRLMEAAKSYESDVKFMRHIIDKQRWFASAQPYTGTVYASGAAPLVEIMPAKVSAYKQYENSGTPAKQAGIIYRPSGIGGSNAGDIEKVNDLGVMPLPTFPQAMLGNEHATENSALAELTMRVYLSYWNLSATEIERIQQLVANWDTVAQDLTPMSAGELFLNKAEREWYGNTTAPLIAEMHRNAYREALNEIIRHLWFYADEPVPADMYVPSPDANTPSYTGQGYVDANGVPLVQRNAPVSLPTIKEGMRVRIVFPTLGTAMPDDLNTFIDPYNYIRKELKTDADDGLRHQMVVQDPYGNHGFEHNFQGVPHPGNYDLPPESNRNSIFDFGALDGINSFDSQQTRAEIASDLSNIVLPEFTFTSASQAPKTNANSEGIRARFFPEKDDDEIVLTTFSYYSSANSFHEVKSAGVVFPMTLSIQMRLEEHGEPPAIYPPEHQWNDEGVEEVEITVEVTTGDVGFVEYFFAYGASVSDLP